MVAFASASAAVGCAVLTQQMFERRYRGAEQRLRVRIGLGTGESTLADGEYFGMPAVEAARLCDKAPTDGILVSPATKLLASRIDGARFESFGELELKGTPESMEAFAVVWEPLADESCFGAGRGLVQPHRSNALCADGTEGDTAWCGRRDARLGAGEPHRESRGHSRRGPAA